MSKQRRRETGESDEVRIKGEKFISVNKCIHNTRLFSKSHLLMFVLQ